MDNRNFQATAGEISILKEMLVRVKAALMKSTFKEAGELFLPGKDFQ